MISEEILKEAKSYINQISEGFNVGMFASRSLSFGEERWALTMFTVAATEVLFDTTFLNKSELKHVFGYHAHSSIINNLKLHDQWITDSNYSYIYNLMLSNSWIAHSWLKNEVAIIDSRSKYISTRRDGVNAKRRDMSAASKPEETEYILNRIKTLQEVGWPHESIIAASPLSNTRTKELLEQLKNE